MIRALIEWFLEIAFVFGVLFVAIILWLLYLIYSNFPEQMFFTITVGASLIGGIYYLRKNTKQKKETNYKTFAEGFLSEPVSGKTIAAFQKLNPEEVKSFFRITYGDGDDNIIKFLVKDALYTPDKFEYSDILRSNIDVIEDQYSKYQKRLF